MWQLCRAFCCTLSTLIPPNIRSERTAQHDGIKGTNGCSLLTVEEKKSVSLLMRVRMHAHVCCGVYSSGSTLQQYIILYATTAHNAEHKADINISGRVVTHQVGTCGNAAVSLVSCLCAVVLPANVFIAVIQYRRCNNPAVLCVAAGCKAESRTAL